ncbi:IclR family transcriptional regulator [Salmonella enterica subsp. enterica serovar Enteritidis]|nr:IclR family transcriptional regulator [Salmonella enterica subsp. enterica serovar Enteritidis]
MLESSKVPALTRAIDILNLIARIGPCSAAIIIETLRIPKSTAYLLLNELKRQRFISSIIRITTACGLSSLNCRVMRSARWICGSWRVLV